MSTENVNTDSKPGGFSKFKGIADQILEGKIKPDSLEEDPFGMKNFRLDT
jgi:hypothetical protein